MSKEKIIGVISAQSDFLKKRYHVKNIGVFGSVARDEDNKNSDVDILVEFDKTIGFFDFIRLENFLSKRLNKKVDLVTKKAVKPALGRKIFKEIIYV
ncbi:MAG TPA: hypothetical protein DCS28_02765 [Candidatus Moranbacteria bacterium]|nr:hypothetical protein [Candidatus Moranbacteria bacterium]HAT74938.1 hypothetical protein [Candidatus Moranbacteria bacterium]